MKTPWTPESVREALRSLTGNRLPVEGLSRAWEAEPRAEAARAVAAAWCEDPAVNGQIAHFFATHPGAAGRDSLCARLPHIGAAQRDPTPGAACQTLRASLLHAILAGEATPSAMALAAAAEVVEGGEGSCLIERLSHHAPEWALSSLERLLPLYPDAPSIFFSRFVAQGVLAEVALSRCLAHASPRGLQRLKWMVERHTQADPALRLQFLSRFPKP